MVSLESLSWNFSTGKLNADYMSDMSDTEVQARANSRRKDKEGKDAEIVNRTI